MTDTQVKESVVEMAVDQTGFGKFSIKVAIICFLIYSNASFGFVSIGYFLTTSSCDLKMTFLDKNLLLTSYFVGSFLSPLVCGFLSNFKGRKWILLLTLLLQGIADLLSAIIPNYWIIMGLKFLSGFSTAGQMIVVFTYMSECLPSKQRDFLMLLMEIFWIAGDAIICSLGLLILPMKFEFRSQYFLFRSWNLFILVCSSYAILLGFFLIIFPETPKYLGEMGQREKLFQVLMEMYCQNSGRSKREYIEKLIRTENSSLIELVNQRRENLPDVIKTLALGKEILKELKQMKEVIMPPFVKNTIFASFVGFAVNFCYDALYVWFPEIFQRFSEVEAKNKNSNFKFCSISHDVSSSHKNMTEDPFECNREIDTQVFIRKLILCAACAPAIFPILFLINRIGFRILLVLHCSFCSAIIVGLYFVNSSLQIIILLCVYLPLISTCITMTSALFVSIFPTKLRSSGVTVIHLTCRMGAIFGNMSFGFLIDYYCLHYIIIIALLLVVGAISTLLIREKKFT